MNGFAILYTNLRCWLEHIVHIDMVTGLSPVTTTSELDQKVWLISHTIDYVNAEPRRCLQHGEYV